MSGTQKKSTNAESQKPSSQAGAPLFFTKPVVITTDRHAKSRLRKDISMAFAAKTNSIPLTIADIPEAAKHYPIVFSGDNDMIPVAVVGLEQSNYYVDAQGQWKKGCYIPSYVRKYPFVFMEMPDSDQLTLCIEEPMLANDGEGQALYEDGQPSAFANNVLEFCAAHHEQHRAARQFCDALKKKNMLLPQRSDIELAGGRKIQLGGFQLIDPEQIKTIVEPDLSEWFKNGYLATLYYVLQSHSNWRNLLDLGNEREQAANTKN